MRVACGHGDPSGSSRCWLRSSTQPVMAPDDSQPARGAQ
ncbi:hypothetical protein SF06_24740 [Pseudomonas flexibilis]|nr:hypothetical protein SF06_24740 [Pseudomonas flexibilis]